jgi:hypothetical protein
MQKSVYVGVTALTLLMTIPASADSITNLQVATIWYTNSNGNGTSSADVYADPQVSGGTTTPLYYCVDLWHDNYIGQSYTITSVPSMSFADSTFTDVDNRIGWLLSQDQSTPDARAAVQLAVWYTVDNTGFTMSSGDPTVTADYNTLISFTGYNAGTTYGADFWQATHDPSNSLYQDLASAPTSSPQVASVPEPSGLILAGSGLLAVIGACRFTRRD